MPRAIRVLPAAERDSSPVVDTLILPLAQRRMQRGFQFGVGGLCIEFDFADPLCLRTDDALVLDDGRLVEVVAEPEPLVEVRAADGIALARLAWRLGDSHAPVQIFDRRLRVQRDPAVEALLESLGVKTVAIEAPFEPEHDAGPAHGHSHDHHSHGPGEHHHHDHAHHDHAHHDHHEHGPDCGHHPAPDKRR